MKLKHLTNLLLPLAVSFLAGCQKSEQSPATVETKSTANSSGPALELKAKWPVGNKYTYRMDLEQQVTMKMPQMPQPMRQDVTMAQTYSLAVLSERPGGGRELEMEFKAQEFDLKVGEQIMMSFDSKSEAASDAQNPFAGPFRKLIGSKLRLLLSASNTVERVEGLDAWLEKIVEDAPGQGSMMIRQMYTEDYFKQLVELAKGLPERPVKPGESWPFQTEITAGPIGKITMNMTTKLAGTTEHDQRQCAELTFSGTMKAAGPPMPGPMGKVSIDQGKVTGTSWFDPELGALIETKSDQTMKLKMEMAQPGGPAGAAMNSDLTQKVTVKLVELTKAGK